MEINKSPIKGPISIEDYVKEVYNKIPETKSFQIAGGFEIPKGVNYELLTTNNILGRLLKIAENNIVAVSEMGNGKSKDYTTDYSKINVDGYNLAKCIPGMNDGKGIEDTCFVSGNYNLNRNKSKIGLVDESITSMIEMDDIGDNGRRKSGNILSIHFTGDGPIKEELSIPEFIKKELQNSKYGINEDNKENIKIICGDTNITVSKCKHLLNNSNMNHNKKLNLNW